jgi:hypothetical protein
VRQTSGVTREAEGENGGRAETARVVQDEIRPGQPGFLSEGFKRYLADKNDLPQSQPEAAAPQADHPPVDPGVETVLRLFNGTIVE